MKLVCIIIAAAIVTAILAHLAWQPEPIINNGSFIPRDNLIQLNGG